MQKEYVSCNIIEHGFDAQIDTINLCCRVTKDNNYEKLVLLPNFKGGKIDWDLFFAKTDELRDIQRNGGTVSACKGCLYLEKKEWDDERYISSININNWIKCNAFCVYCDRKENLHKKAYDIYPLIRDLINNNYLRNPADITIAGGEPTITRDFDRTIKLLIQHKIKQVRVLTNAIKFNKYIALGLKENLLNILVSTDSGTRETYKKIKLVDKHKDVWKNIAKYAQFQSIDSLVKTKYILLPQYNDNKSELKEFILRNKEAGVKYCHIDVEAAWFCDNPNDISISKHLYELYLFIKDYAKQENINVSAFDRIQLIKNRIN